MGNLPETKSILSYLILIDLVLTVNFLSLIIYYIMLKVYILNKCMLYV